MVVFSSMSFFFARWTNSWTTSLIATAGGTLSEEFVLVDLQEARRLLEEISGARTADDVLIHVFSRFCIGK